MCGLVVGIDVALFGDGFTANHPARADGVECQESIPLPRACNDTPNMARRVYRPYHCCRRKLPASND